MSFVREALAVAVLEALCPRAAVAAGTGYPTNAGGRVYLERAGALDDLEPEQQAPVIVIYTGSDDATSGDGAGSPYLRVIEVDIVVSIVAQVAMEEPGEDGPVSVLIVPRSDREMFSALNAIEAQVRAALLFGETGRVFRRLKQKIPSIRSEPSRDPEEGIKLAERRLTLPVRVPDDCVPAAGATGLARLPEPLRSVAQDLMDTGYAAEIAAALADAAPVPPVLPPFRGLSLHIDLSQPADGVADVTADIVIPQD